eukprot:1226298-Amphidinium_carterae.1
MLEQWSYSVGLMGPHRALPLHTQMLPHVHPFHALYDGTAIGTLLVQQLVRQAQHLSKLKRGQLAEASARCAVT